MAPSWFPIEFKLKRGDRVKLLDSEGNTYTRGDANYEEILVYTGTILGAPKGESYPIRWDWSDNDRGQTPVMGTVPFDYDPFWAIKCHCGNQAAREDYLCKDCRS